MSVQWLATAVLSFDLAADGPESVAQGLARGRISQAMPEASVREIHVRRKLVVGDLVSRERAPGRPEYARVLQTADGKLVAEFADGTRQPLHAAAAGRDGHAH